MTHLSGTNLDRAGRGLQPRPERFDAHAIFEPYGKPCERGSIPRSAIVAIESSQDIKQEVSV